MRWKRQFKISCVLFCFLGAEIFAQSRAHTIHTIVTPLAGEDFARSCEYDMDGLPSGKKIRGVFVVFERGPASVRFYNAPEVLSFADKHDFAMMMPRHCAAKGNQDMDIDPSNGLGRALFAALDQFSTQTDHPELKTAPVILLGYSGAGAFVGRLVGFAPQRVAAAVLSHPGSSPLNLDTIQLSGVALAVPELIIVGGKDKIVGTQLSFAYFSKYWGLGAPWLFAIENNVGHCCFFDDGKDLIMTWLDAVLRKRLHQSGDSLATIHKTHGYYAFFRKNPTEVGNNGNLVTFNAVDLRFQQSDSSREGNVDSAGYLPSKKTASAWLNFAGPAN